MPALKSAAHYAPFATLIPVAGSDVIELMTRHYLNAMSGLGAAQCEALAKRWRLEPGASRALLQAVTKHKQVRSEEAAAMAALTVIPAHITGDSGWAAVRTAVHGGRVFGCFLGLSPPGGVGLWGPPPGGIPPSAPAGGSPPPAARGGEKRGGSPAPPVKA